jgi:hypothetical protein
MSNAISNRARPSERLPSYLRLESSWSDPKIILRLDKNPTGALAADLFRSGTSEDLTIDWALVGV